MKNRRETSWEPVEGWYHRIVGKEGHYYHQSFVIPAMLRLIGKESKVLDVGCGQGILSRALGDACHYFGVDLSESLVKEAKKLCRIKGHAFMVADSANELKGVDNDFTHAVFILSLQNMASPERALKNAAACLKDGGTMILVLNHPCFRIPRQSSWGVDERQKVQYRRVDRYMSPMEIPIQAKPSQGKSSSETWSYHFPLSSLTQWLNGAGLAIETIEEWCSDKESTGGAAKMENRARMEIPLFMIVKAKKRTGDCLKT